MARPKWKLTVRSGPDVEHLSFEELGEAVSAMRARALEIRAEGPAEPTSVLRDFKPGDQVMARLQLSGGSWLHKSVAGIDVRGDGTFMPYRGGMRREELDPSRHETPFDLVRETLEGDG
ncbi:MAG TPA: hypothetical protein VG816_11600 [Solirubrobacterales bacterium]|nr:hypothetical protein [Solirubrobacterales bacterium]